MADRLGQRVGGEPMTEIFTPSQDWQEVSPDTPLPPGLEIRMDLNAGKSFARLQSTPQNGNGHKANKPPAPTKSNLDLALALAGRGWLVFPCREKQGQPFTNKRGQAFTPEVKAPYWHKSDLRNGKDDATNDPAIIRRWWARWPGALVGISCEASGFFAVDIDNKNGANGSQEWGTLVETFGAAQPVACGPCQATPSGGAHLLFALPAGVKIPNNAGKLAPGIDLRSAGYICTGSLPDGNEYTWQPEHGFDTPLCNPPQWLVNRIVAISTNATKPADPKPSQPITAPANGQRNGRKWLENAINAAQPGNRNNMGFSLACQLRDDGLSYDTALAIMQEYARRVPGTDYYEQEAIASLDTAYKSIPRPPAQHVTNSFGGNGHNNNGHKPIQQAQPPADPEALFTAAINAAPADKLPALQALAQALSTYDTFIVGDYAKRAAKAGLCGATDFRRAVAQVAQNAKSTGNGKPTDDELRDRYLKTHPLTVYGLEDWRRYAGGVWPVIDKDLVGAEVIRVLEDAKGEGVRPTEGLKSSVMEFARQKVFIPTVKWDADPDILICANGTLHTPTRTLRPHSPDDYATTALEISYDPQAIAPSWGRFLQSTFPPANMPGVIEFIQEFFGYCLTTDTKHELSLWLYSPPGGGKSTLITGAMAMLGPKSCLLGLADIELSRFSLADLPGKTLAVSAEQPGMFLRATHILNAIVSGEPVSIERKYQNPVTITPTVKLLYGMNELPIISDPNNGIFRRIRVLEMRPIPESKRDPSLKDKIKAEGAGILNWALDGFERLQKRGRFVIPQCIQQATENFKASSDTEAAFVADKCETGATHETGGQELYDSYRTWCERNGHKAKSITRVAEEWRRLGFEKVEKKTGSIWVGLRLKGNVP